MRKKYENAIQEKETAVMKYVNNESELINVRKEKNNLTKRLKTIEIERDDLLKKSKLVTSEKIAALRNLEQKVRQNFILNYLVSIIIFINY